MMGAQRVRTAGRVRRKRRGRGIEPAVRTPRRRAGRAVRPSQKGCSRRVSVPQPRPCYDRPICVARARSDRPICSPQLSRLRQRTHRRSRAVGHSAWSRPCLDASQVACWMPATAARAAGRRAPGSHDYNYSRRLAGVGCLAAGGWLQRQCVLMHSTCTSCSGVVSTPILSPRGSRDGR